MSADSPLRALARATTTRHHIPEQTLHLAKLHFMETLGVALAGVSERAVRVLSSTLPEVAAGPARGARSVVSARLLSPRDAAISNGTAGHAHDFDDDEPHVVVGHPSVAVVAALLSLAEEQPLSTRNALAAYVLGVETMFRLGAVVNPRQYNLGWHCTATLGTLGAAAACAAAMALDESQAMEALDVAATFACGFKENFGSDLKPLQVGAAAGNGLWSAQLAKAGLRTSRGALFGPRGFIALLGGGSVADAAFERFGTPWSLENPGINIKLYPCCSSTHTAIDALLDLLSTTRDEPDEVERIDVWVGADVPAILLHDVPTNGLEGKFSMRYCLAVAAYRRAVRLEAFTDEAVRDPAVLAMLDRVSMHIDTTLPRESTGVTHRSRVRLSWRSGWQSERECEHPRGSPAHPCSTQELRTKFLSCATHGIGTDGATRVWGAAESMGTDEPLSGLLDALWGDEA